MDRKDIDDATRALWVSSPKDNIRLSAWWVRSQKEDRYSTLHARIVSGRFSLLSWFTEV
jgi:hypothetical protein